jgi:hypothetical protein
MERRAQAEQRQEKQRCHRGEASQDRHSFFPPKLLTLDGPQQPVFIAPKFDKGIISKAKHSYYPWDTDVNTFLSENWQRSAAS